METLTALRVFVRVVDAGSFSAAGRGLDLCNVPVVFPLKCGLGGERPLRLAEHLGVYRRTLACRSGHTGRRVESRAFKDCSTVKHQRLSTNRRRSSS